jgi:hypothetical protein
MVERRDIYREDTLLEDLTTDRRIILQGEA